jgi:hypothetical protein
MSKLMTTESQDFLNVNDSRRLGVFILYIFLARCGLISLIIARASAFSKNDPTTLLDTMLRYLSRVCGYVTKKTPTNKEEIERSSAEAPSG